MRRFAAFALFALFAALAAPSADSQLSDKARMLLDYQSFTRGDRDGAVRFCLNAVRELQGTPLAELAVRIAMFYDPVDLSAVDVGDNEARRLLGGEIDLNPDLRDILRRFVARSHVVAGRREEAREVHRLRGLAMSWLVAGPFHGRRAAGFASRELPEAGPILEQDVLADPPDEARFREWRRNPPWRPLPENRCFPFVRPWRWSGGGVDGSMLMFSGLKLDDADSKAAFHVYSETSWRLFVDGALVAEIDRDNLDVPNEHMVFYPLSSGTHAVALQVFPPGADTDPRNVRVALRMESSSAVTWDRFSAGPERRPAANARREPRRLRHLVELEERMRDHPMLMTAYALACFEQGMRDVGAWWAETAARAEPGDMNLLLIAGSLVAQNPLLPSERRRDFAAAWHKAALAVTPGVVPSLLYLAGVASESGAVREAAEYLDRAYAVNHGSLDILMARAVWASRFASAATARAAREEAARAFPNSSSVQVAVASMPQEGFLDMERRLEACRAAVAAGPNNYEASLLLAEALADSGNAQEAASALRNALDLFDGEVAIMERIADVYARLLFFPEAEEVLSEAVRLCPDDADLWRRMGDLRMASGDEEGALGFWRVSLDAGPGQFSLSDMVNHLSGGPDRLYSEGGYDAIVLTAGADASRYQADVVRLLDRALLMFAGDGSHRRLTHEVDMAGTRRGGESLAGIDARGELLTARIVFPNGNTLEPEPFPGQEGLRLPVTIPGASRELRMLESIPARRGRRTRIPAWFFQDPSGRMPLLLSEYVVRAPRNFPLVHVTRDFGRAVDFEMSREGDFDVYRWTARLGVPGHEPDAVHISERVPSVEIGVKTTWDEIVRQELRDLDGRLTPSMRMRNLLERLYHIEPDERPDPVRAARSIYRYVLDNIDPTPAGTAAAHVHVDRMGDRRLLLLALLRAAGLAAHPAAARPSVDFMHAPTWELPDRAVFPVPMVRLVMPDGGIFWLDVRFDALPFGKIADDLSGATVLSFMPGGPLFEILPNLPAEDSIVFKERRLNLPAGDAPLEVAGRSLRRGVAGLQRGQAMAEADADARRKMLLASLFPIFPDAVVERFDVVRPDESDASYQERYELVSAIAVEERPDGQKAVPLCMPPPRIISDETRNLTSRRTTCHIKAVRIAEDRNIFILPRGGAFVRLPEPAHIPSRFGMYQLRVLPHGDNGVEIIRNYHIPAQRIPPWAWTDFLAFLARVDMAEKQWLEYAEH